MTKARWSTRELIELNACIDVYGKKDAIGEFIKMFPERTPAAVSRKIDRIIEDRKNREETDMEMTITEDVQNFSDNAEDTVRPTEDTVENEFDKQVSSENKGIFAKIADWLRFAWNAKKIEMEEDTADNQ